MRLAFTLRGETPVGASVISGVSGHLLDVTDLLRQEGGEIVTDDPAIQTALRGLFGADGPVFDVSVVDESGQRSPHQDEQPKGFVDTSPEVSTTTVVTDEPEDLDELTISELRHRASREGLHTHPSMTKAQLVALLEGDDDQEGSE